MTVDMVAQRECSYQRNEVHNHLNDLALLGSILTAMKEITFFHEGIVILIIKLRITP